MGKFDSPDQKVEKQLVQMSNTTNKNLPLTLDSETVLATTLPGPGRKFTYFYSVVNYAKGEVNLDYFSGLKPGMVTNLKSAFKTDAGMKYMFDNQVTVDYVYKDKLGEYM